MAKTRQARIGQSHKHIQCKNTIIYHPAKYLFPSYLFALLITLDTLNLQSTCTMGSPQKHIPCLVNHRLHIQAKTGYMGCLLSGSLLISIVI